MHGYICLALFVEALKHSIKLQVHKTYEMYKLVIIIA